MLTWIEHRTIRTQVAGAVAATVCISTVFTYVLVLQAIPTSLGPGMEQEAARVLSVVRPVLGLVGLLTVAGSIGAGVILTASLRQAIVRMRNATEALAAGDLAHRIPRGRRDVLGELSQSINEMAGRLEDLSLIHI